VLVTGAGGQLGLDVIDAFEDHDVVALAHADLDIGDEAAVTAAVETARPRLIINTAAWTDVDGCEADPGRAHRDNALGPWWLARAAGRAGATLVTFSTDYVFDGTARTGSDGSPRGFTEWDTVAPLSAYGRSKAAGEALVRESLPAHHIVRTAWVSGARGANFVRTILRVARSEGALSVVDDQVGSPTTTRALARAVRALAVSGRHGTVNLVCEGRCSWFDYARAIVEDVGLDVTVERRSSIDTPRPAARPAWSVLDTTHARALGVGPLPAWREALRELLVELGERDPDAAPGR